MRLRGWMMLTVGLVLVSLTDPLTSRAAPANVRVALVNVPDDVLRPLLPEFQKQTGRAAQIVYTGPDPYGAARRGEADLVISHYGHEGVEPFITAGLGLWPHPVFANQMALLGPSSDPAHVRGLTNAAEAFRRIAQTRSPFVINNSAGAKYIEEILWTSGGVASKGDWYLDMKLQGQEAVLAASQQHAYILWGVPPFLRLKRQSKLDLEPLVVSDSLFQRIMVSVVVNPQKVSGADRVGAETLQKYLLAPSTQAHIRAFRYPDFNQQVWWPSGRHQQRPRVGQLTL